MTVKNRTIQLAVGLTIAAVGFASTACNQIDVNTEEGLIKALESRQKLDKAIPKISGMITRPDEMKPYIPALIKLYTDGSMFDREVIQALASAGDSSADVAFEKAVQSSDYKQIIQAAYGIRRTHNANIQNKLLDIYDAQINPEVQRAILETGKDIKNEAMAKKAQAVLEGNLDETAFVLITTSCDVLAYQQDPAAVNTLMRAIYHQTGVGRSPVEPCTRALLALNKAVAVPPLLEAYQLKNSALNAYVAAHPDTLTPESVRNNSANALALFRAEEAIEPMLDYLGDTHTIPVPGTLALKPNGDPAWNGWGTLVGTSSQSTMFALNDIGIRNNERAKTILVDIFNWTDAYQAKFKNAVKQTGVTLIEVSQRVNAFKLLRENELISSTETVDMINSLKGEEFLDERTNRPYARAAIGTDMVTYAAITSKPGETDSVWTAFNALKAAEFNVPEPEGPDAIKLQNVNDGVSERIAKTKATFELADRCKADYTCYAQTLQDGANNKDFTEYERIKCIYELGFSGDHKYFETICKQFAILDVFGQIYATQALARLGSNADVETIEALNKELSRNMNQTNYSAAKRNLEGLVTTLKNK